MDELTSTASSTAPGAQGQDRDRTVVPFARSIHGRLMLIVATILIVVGLVNTLVALALSTPEADVATDWSVRLVLAALSVIAGVVAAYYLARPTTDRIRALADHATESAQHILPKMLEDVTQGRLDPAGITVPRLEIEGTDEVAMLGDALAAHGKAVEVMATAFADRMVGADARFRAGFERSPAAMAIVDVDGSIMEANSSFASLLGIAQPSLMVGHEWLAHVHGDDQEMCRRALYSDTPAEPQTVRYVRVNGEIAHVLQTWVVVPADDGSRVTFLQGTDVSETRRVTETLQQLAFSDLLTGLPNRAALERRVAESRATIGPGSLVGIAVLDLDRFKLINDSLGHSEGDKVLRAVGKRLRSSVPEGGLVARTGGDEFTVLITNLPSADVLALLAERLIATLEAPIAIGGRRFYVTASIGLASTTHADDIDDLSAQADAAAYAAKTGGRRRWLMFDQTMARAANERLELENDLREALGDRQLELHYQPIVDSKNRQLTGLEALVRWRHPTRGLMSPAMFIELAEDTGLITQLGWEVLDLALADVSRLSGVAGVHDSWRMSVNVSPAQLRHPEFVSEVASRLHEAGVPAERLMLEITESMLVEDDIIDRVQDLRRLGIWIALDDFGTGYTGVAYLSKVGVDVLKIDMAIVQGATDPRGHAVLRAIGELGQALGMRVVAEGVEDESDAQRATECFCDRLQGYGIGRPVPVADIATRVLPAMARD